MPRRKLGPDEYIGDDGDLMTRDEAIAIGQLEKLAKHWPKTLKLVSMAGEIYIIRNDDKPANEHVSHTPGSHRRHPERRRRLVTGRSAADVIGEDGKVRVLSRRCGTCLFRRDHPFGSERATEVIEANVTAGALLTCHSTLPYGGHPDFGPAVCAGFWAQHAMSTAAGRMARFLLGVTRIDPPGS